MSAWRLRLLLLHKSCSKGRSVKERKLIAYKGRRVFRSIRSPNTLHADRAIRLNPITDYGLIRSRNSVHGDHL